MLHLSLGPVRHTAPDTVRVYLQDVAAAYQWHGWGLDNNTLCPSAQISTRQEVLCEPGYPGDIDQASHSWTGITCTPDGHVTCLSLPGYGLSGNISLLHDLAPLTDMQLLNIANNSFTGELVLMICHTLNGRHIQYEVLAASASRFCLFDLQVPCQQIYRISSLTAQQVSLQ